MKRITVDRDSVSVDGRLCVELRIAPHGADFGEIDTYPYVPEDSLYLSRDEFGREWLNYRSVGLLFDVDKAVLV